MDMDTDTDLTTLSSHSHEFTPINSPKGEEMDRVNATIRNEQNDQALASIETEEDTEETTSTPIEASASSRATETTAGRYTSRKRGRKPAASSSTTTPNKKSKKDTSTSTGDGEPSTPGAGSANGGTPTRATLPPIPTSLAAAGVEDRMILRLRDDENWPWGEITKTFVSATGIKVGSSTLRMRHTTMKANFVDISKEDEARFLRLKKEIEEKFEIEKWNRIGDAIVQDGGAKYPAPALQKKFKELSKNLNTFASASGLGSKTGGAGKHSDDED